MALHLTQAYPNGFSGDYWKICDVHVDYLNQRSSVTLLLYKDKATRMANFTTGMMGQFQRNWNDTAFPFTDISTDPREVAYQKLMTDPLDDTGQSNPFLNATEV